MKQNIIESILIINNKCLSESERKIVLKDLSSREAAILLSIEADEEITGNELARRNALSPSRMSRIVDKLSSKEYLLRHMSENDRRSIRLSLSKKGVLQRSSILAYNRTCEEKLRSSLKDDELKTVQDALNILLKIMDRGKDE